MDSFAIIPSAIGKMTLASLVEIH